MQKNSIRIVSDGTPMNTKILTHEGHEIRGCKALEIKIDADHCATARLDFLMSSFDFVIDKDGLDGQSKHLLMDIHNRCEMMRLGISRIH